MIETSATALTPIHFVEGNYFKREDLFQPFPGLKINGGKARQCIRIVQLAKPREIISYSSMYSPQIAIVAAVGAHLGIPVKYLVGGQIETPYIKLAKSLGADIVRLKPYRENYLFSQAKRMCSSSSLLIRSGMVHPDFIDAQIDTISRQVENIPDHINSIVLTCGSGLTTVGVLKGITTFAKSIQKMYLINTAPDRLNFIRNQLNRLHVTLKCKLMHYSLFNEKGFEYKKQATFSIGDIIFHPQYEAKSFQWIISNKPFSLRKNIFWIVGGDII